LRILFSILFLLQLGYTQSWYNHPELVWKTFETEHFIFHYHEGTEKTVNEAAYVAEAIYAPITDYYDYRPETKTTIIIKDTDDIANGTAYYYDNKLEIWAHPLDFDLRGSHRWLQNVITHEFTHIIQIGKSMKASTRFPAFYFQGFSYEDEKRDDVLYGYPNKIFSIPIPGVAVPPWLAEGTAQYMNPELYYDFWDSHRDMLLRDLVINNRLLSLDEMNTFGKQGIGSEAVYNQGFSFSSYLSDRFGSQILPQISKSLGSTTFSINKAIYKTTGSFGYDLYSDWVEFLQQDYNDQLKVVEENKVEGKIIEGDGTTNLFPKWSPNGKKIAFISNKENDYFGQTDLFIYNLEDSTSTKLIGGAKYAPAWLNDTTLIFTLRSKPNKNGSKYYNLYKMSLNQDEPDQLTEDKRLRSPIFNPKNNLIAAISTVDGSSNIFISDSDSIDFKKVTSFNNQEYISSINWDDDNILIDAITDHGRDIYEIDFTSQVTSTKILDTYDDVRNPCYSDGLLYFSHDYKGIFNISYQEDGEFKFLTNVLGGAFMPDIRNNSMVYSIYKDGGYKIAVLSDLKAISSNSVGYHEPKIKKITHLDLPKNLNFNQSDNYFGSTVDEIRYYSSQMSEIHFVPRIMLDYKTQKYGFYMFSDDMIGDLSLFGGFSINRIKDVDAMLMFDYKRFKPTLYFNFYWATRHTEQNFPYYDINNQLVDNITINNDVNYQLFTSDIGIRFPFKDYKLWLSYSYSNYKQNIIQVSSHEYEYNDETITDILFGKLGFDYYRGHVFSVRAFTKQIKPHYLSTMLTKNGYTIDATLKYEFNSFMDGFALNNDYGTWGAVFEPNNTFRFNLDAHYFNNFKNIFFLELSSNIGFISNKNADDFFHFFGGGLSGLKGYTFYNPSLTGLGLYINSAYIRTPLLNDRFFYFKDFVVFNNLSVGLISQFASVYNEDFDDLYSNIKFSSGFELRAKGFIFYGYPAAITLEHHFPIADNQETDSKTYLRFLFDF